jgi:hypothetical protein
MKEIQEILDEFVEKCHKKLELFSILQFGSSTYSKNFEDIDLLFISKHPVIPTKENLELIKIIKDFENRYDEVVFDFGGVADRERKAKYSISAILIGLSDLNVKHNPHDLFFYKSLSSDKNIKLLYGKNILENKEFVLTKQHIFEILTVDQKHAMRKFFENNSIKSESFYYLFKTFLRVMLVNEGDFKKEELIKKFKEKFKEKIKLPKNYEKIIKNKIKKGDFEDILKFTEDCLMLLVK